MSKYEELFNEVLDIIDFELIKYKNGWGLIDKQLADLGDIESERFDNVVKLVDRLEMYIEDYFVEEIRIEVEELAEMTWKEIIDTAPNELNQQQSEAYKFNLLVLDMICNHKDEIEFENCRYTVEE
ncbi:hypothetical protein [uncultured Oscillibacter sp.]|uniref:hypothetical protein n=1 Tax=uncultured Oscillibacter sp. TaxID=876091 RepID=UPI0026118B25|nr:hypothetical protein [uncultured Oscillibacter sp.]